MSFFIWQKVGNNVSKEKKLSGERLWANSICELLKQKLDEDKYYIDVEVPLVHSCNLNNGFKSINKKSKEKIRDIKIPNIEAQTWNTDLFIGEKIDDKIIPRVIIEAKYNSANLHGPITYNYNSGLHKNLYPGLRYGFIIGNYDSENTGKDSDIPKQLINHGTNFDFIFVFNKDKLSSEEEEKFITVIKDNLNKSKQLEQFLTENKRIKNRKKYWYFTRDIEFSDDFE